MTGSTVTDVGWIGVGLGLAADLVIGLIRGANTGDAGPGASAASIGAVTTLLAAPAVVGAIGLASRRREPLIAAGLAYMPLAMLSFSGVTLVLLIPAALFVYVGSRGSALFDGVAPRTARPAVVAIVGVLAAGLIGLFATMTGVCWEQTADGTIHEREVPVEGVLDGGEVMVGAGDVIASGCSTGVVSTAGLVIVCLSTAAAVGLAVRIGPTDDRPGR